MMDRQGRARLVEGAGQGSGAREDEAALLAGGIARRQSPRRPAALAAGLALALLGCFAAGRWATGASSRSRQGPRGAAAAGVEALWEDEAGPGDAAPLDLPGGGLASAQPDLLEEQSDVPVAGALSATADWMSNAVGAVQSQLQSSGLIWGDLPKDDSFSDAFGELSDDGGDLDARPTRGAAQPTAGWRLAGSAGPATGEGGVAALDADMGFGGAGGGEEDWQDLAPPGAAGQSQAGPDRISSTTVAVAPSTTSTTSRISTTSTTSTSSSATAGNRLLWEVVFAGPVNVRAEPNFEATVLRVMWKCERFSGSLDGSGWIQLDDEDGQGGGYMMSTYRDRTLAAEVPDERSLVLVGRPGKRRGGVRRKKCVPCSDATPCASMRWQVRHQGPASVHASASNSSKVTDYKWKCEIVHGVRHQDWLMLTQEDDTLDASTSFMPILDKAGHRNLEEVTTTRLEDLQCESCAEGLDSDCSQAGCCKADGTQCYRNSSDGPPRCQYTCQPNDKGQGCEEIGSRSWMPMRPSFPTLFCFSLIRPNSYEVDLTRAQVAAGAGIFACDDFTVLSPEGISLGALPGGQEVKTLHSEYAEVGVSKDNTAANTQIFFNAWDAIHRESKYLDHSWTIKTDPDAVLLPNRVRLKTMDRGIDGTQEAIYFANCNRFKEAPDFPMMYGAVEVLSREAATRYLEEGYKCMSLPYSDWGEDVYLAKCLREVLGVKRVFEPTIVGDSRCEGGACWDHAFSAYHEYKSVDLWFGCWNQTGGSF